ncbi:hypothetical protein [Aureivirga marina]|uniref:hypothetical protein n=1 Tax=Aureivirga marina TaxID=1182451 RepID=UPI0018CB3824|nr:hypothetical protein [Aureivirga marina]
MKKKILLGSLSIFLIVILWFFYEIKIKDVINDYYKEKIQENLIENFAKNQNHFEETVSFIKKLKHLKSLELEKDSTFRITISDVSTNDYLQSYSINIEIDSINNYSDILKMDINHFTFFGNNINPTLEKFLVEKGISVNDLEQLKNYLNKIDCFAYETHKDGINFKYRGNYIESINYVFSLNNDLSNDELHLIHSNFYWKYYELGLICGFEMNWRLYQ